MLITRYLIRNLFLATLFIAVTLTIVIWLTQSLKLLEIVTNSDAPAGLFLKLVVLSLPKFLEIILPVALVISILFTYNKLIMDNELIVMRACGIDQMALARPALGLAIVVTCILLSLTTYFSPKSKAELVTMRQTVKAQYSAFLLREGVFNTFGKSLTVYLRHRSPQGALYGLMIHDTRNLDKEPVTVTAKKGHIVMDGDIPTIVVFDGMRQQMDKKTGHVSRLHFSKYTIEIENLKTGTKKRWQDADERTLTELMNPDMSNSRDRAKRDLFLAEINHRLVTPFNALGFALISLVSILLGNFNRRGQTRKITIAAIIVIIGQTLNLTIAGLMKKNIGFTGLLYLTTLLPIVGGFWLLHLRGEQIVMTFSRKWRQWRFKPDKIEQGESA